MLVVSGRRIPFLSIEIKHEKAFLHHLLKGSNTLWRGELVRIKAWSTTHCSMKLMLVDSIGNTHFLFPCYGSVGGAELEMWRPRFFPPEQEPPFILTFPFGDLWLHAYIFKHREEMPVRALTRRYSVVKKGTL